MRLLFWPLNQRVVTHSARMERGLFNWAAIFYGKWPKGHFKLVRQEPIQNRPHQGAGQLSLPAAENRLISDFAIVFS